MADLIPVFPLSHVLVPGMALPLHIFEPRYRQLLSDVQRGPDKAAFGIVALRTGGELAQSPPGDQPPDIAEVGTLAEILEVEPFEDGASDLLTVGSRRFRILELVTDGAPYHRARVDWLAERTGSLRPHEVAVTHKLCRDHAELLESLTGRDRAVELPGDANLLSYHVAAQLPLAPADRQALLEQPTAADRLVLAIALLRREISLLQSTRSICVAPGVLQLVAHPN